MGQIEDLRLFVLIVEEGSITKAADKLNIAKSAVSRRLGLLEARFEATLIDRQPGTWQVTDAGRELFQRASTVVGEIDEIAEDFAQTSHSLAGPLSISVAHEFGLAFLSPALIAFKDRHPDIQLSVTFDNRTVDLAVENFDLAIRVTADLIDDTNATCIGTAQHSIYAAPGYLDAHGTPATLGDLQDHALLNYGSQKRGVWNFRDSSGRRNQVTFRPVVGSNSGAFLADATKAGLGIARLPDFVGRAHFEAGTIVRVLKNQEPSPLYIYLMYAENRRPNRRMRVFAEEMTKVCAVHSACQDG